METIRAEVDLALEKRDRRGRKMTPKQRRGEVVAAFVASGLTQRAFARREGVNANTLAKWILQHRQASEAVPVRFAEVSVAAPQWSFEVTLPSGCVVRANSAHAVAELLGMVRTSS